MKSVKSMNMDYNNATFECHPTVVEFIEMNCIPTGSSVFFNGQGVDRDFVIDFNSCKQHLNFVLDYATRYSENPEQNQHEREFYNVKFVQYRNNPGVYYFRYGRLDIDPGDLIDMVDLIIVKSEPELLVWSRATGAFQRLLPEIPSKLRKLLKENKKLRVTLFETIKNKIREKR